MPIAAYGASAQDTGWLTASNCGSVSNPRPNGTICLQTSTTGGRTAGHFYRWNGASWDDVTGGGSGVTGSGTTGKLPKWTGATALGDSILTETSGLITAAGSLAAGGFNSLTIAPSTTGNPVTIAASGGDTDVSINLLAKGTGFVNVTNDPSDPQGYLFAPFNVVTYASAGGTDYNASFAYLKTLAGNENNIYSNFISQTIDGVGNLTGSNTALNVDALFGATGTVQRYYGATFLAELAGTANATEIYGALYGVNNLGSGIAANAYGSAVQKFTTGGGITNAFAFYSEDQSAVATNGYFLWYNSPGVYRIKADGVTAYYNPAFSPKYTPGGLDYERIVQQWNTNVAEIGTEAGGTGTLRALRLIGSGYKLSALTSNGFVKTSGSDGTLSVDTTSYQTALVNSAGLLAALSDETGTGLAVFATAPALTGPIVLTEAVGSSALTITGATQTASFPALNITQIWNNSGTTFGGVIKANVTNTASAADSMLVDLQLGGASQFRLDANWAGTGVTHPAILLGTGTPGVSDVGWVRYDQGGTVAGLYTINGAGIWGTTESGVVTRSDKSVAWRSAANFSAYTTDVALRRNAAGILEITNSTAGQWGSLLVGVRDAGTTTTTNGLTIGHQSTGTPAAGLGSAVLFNINSSTTADQNAAQISALWTDATHATRTADVVVKTVNSAAALAEAVRITGAGQLLVQGLKTTGAATGKTVVCVDTTTGQLYASTSGIACAN